METIKQDTKKSKAIDSVEDFDMEVRNLQFEGGGDIEVTKKFFDRLTKGSTKKQSITYGSPGVRVFVEGERERILEEESMDAISHYELEIKRKGQRK